MARLVSSLVGTLAFTAFLLAAALGRADGAPDHAALDHVFVRVTDGGLRPGIARLRADQAIGFLNSSSFVVRVSFDASIAARIKCRSQASFTRVGARLESARIQGSQFASLCSLAPGEYAYRVDLQTSAGAGSDLAVSSFDGTLRVE
jgi:hypothetical protein